MEEDLGFAASGTGQHVLLKVRKRNANTQWVARELSKLCGCHPRDVGYAGLKDRRAIAIQFFTVPRSKFSLEAWREVQQPEFNVLEASEHSRKLPRGGQNKAAFGRTQCTQALRNTGEVRPVVAKALRTEVVGDT